ncbi:flagellar export chaperone FliS [Nitrincola schmidtii]|uniref:flagellar export chaperone FliS n=1 Tax=Nitrincola schmidtii TaxID=1730894 RepID=UPI00124ECC16|nr:flagellar export chaperone FliS [Nitrincola schmidtii]
MNMHRATQAYQQINISSEIEHASPHRLISMLFEGALKQTATAKGALSRNDIEARGLAISRAIAIVGELQACLRDLETNPVSANLFALYEYVLRCLIEANLQGNVNKLDEVLNILVEIKSGWDAIPEEQRTAIKKENNNPSSVNP